MPCPPPMQAVASPYRNPFRRNSFKIVITSRVPDAPNGWHSAIAPPFTFVLSRFNPNIFSTARYCAAKASFTSTRSICSSVSPASFSAFCDDGTGPIPMMLGSTPATAHDTIRPTGFNPCSFAIFSLVTTTAAPPSTIPNNDPPGPPSGSLPALLHPASILSAPREPQMAPASCSPSHLQAPSSLHQATTAAPPAQSPQSPTRTTGSPSPPAFRFSA